MIPGRRYGLIVLALLLLTGCSRRSGLTDVSYILRLDMPYARTNNFTGHRLYWEGRCFLRPETAQKLVAADEELKSAGLTLKVFDCYRPLSVQRRMWAIVPDERYVANPDKGSRHNRGAAVDVSLVRLSDGVEVWMPTLHDDFSERAHRDYMNLPPEPLENRKKLEEVMTRHGFIGLPTEWWHFDDSDWQKYEILDVQFRELKPY
jgi:D-alanyl-D-alanine dipeptidase